MEEQLECITTSAVAGASNELTPAASGTDSGPGETTTWPTSSSASAVSELNAYEVNSPIGSNCHRCNGKAQKANDLLSCMKDQCRISFHRHPCGNNFSLHKSFGLDKAATADLAARCPLCERLCLCCTPRETELQVGLLPCGPWRYKLFKTNKQPDFERLEKFWSSTLEAAQTRVPLYASAENSHKARSALNDAKAWTEERLKKLKAKKLGETAAEPESAGVAEEREAEEEVDGNQELRDDTEALAGSLGAVAITADAVAAPHSDLVLTETGRADIIAARLILAHPGSVEERVKLEFALQALSDNDLVTNPGAADGMGSDRPGMVSWLWESQKRLGRVVGIAANRYDYSVPPTPVMPQRSLSSGLSSGYLPESMWRNV